MKRTYLKYKDLLCVAHVNKQFMSDLRFDLRPLMLFVIDSLGRNCVVGFILSEDTIESYTDCLLKFKSYVGAKPKQILMKRVPL